MPNSRRTNQPMRQLESEQLDSVKIDGAEAPYMEARPEKSTLAKLRFLFRHLWIIGLCLLASLLLSIGYIMKAVPIYQATVVLKVAEQQVRVYNAKDDAGNGEDDLRGDDILNTITQSLKLGSLYDRVASDPSVQADVNIVPATDSGTPPSSIQQLAGMIDKSTTVSLRRGTRLIDVNVENPVPEAAQKLATVVVDQFIAMNAESDIDTSNSKRKFLLDDVAKTRASLQKAEDGLEIYKEALRQKQRVDEQQKVVDNLSQRYLDGHPKLIEARSLIAQLKQGFDAEIKKVIASSPIEADYWATNENSLPAGTQDDLVASELKLVEARTSVLQSQADTESALFDSLLKQMREEDVKTESAPIGVKVVDAATLPTAPIRPNRVLVIRDSILGGLLLGIGLVYFLQRFDSTLSSAQELEQLTNLPVIATIPKIPRTALAKRSGRKSKSASDASAEDGLFKEIALVSEPAGIVAENIRSFRAALELIGKAEDRRTTLFSSALPGEGKTFTSCNYSVALAQQGLRTLLIDCDLRRPAVHGRFDLKNDQPGLTDHVGRGLDLSEVVRANVVDNLDLLLTGSKCYNPAEFLGGRGFVETLEGALLKYDRVVVDSPPIILVSDTRLIAPYIQAICLVVRAESTSSDAVLRALHFLEIAHSRPVGLIFNCVAEWSMDEYHGYNTSQKYKYGNAYGDHADARKSSG